MSGGAGLVLVVEAERSVSAPLEHLLRLRNFETVMAETPERALEVLRTHKPGGGHHRPRHPARRWPRRHRTHAAACAGHHGGGIPRGRW